MIRRPPRSTLFPSTPLSRSALVAVSLLAGMEGYEHYEHLPWRDAFLNTAMLLSGMGPVDAPHTNGGKMFASRDRKSTRLNSSHDQISYAVFCLKKKKKKIDI